MLLARWNVFCTIDENELHKKKMPENQEKGAKHRFVQKKKLHCTEVSQLYFLIWVVLSIDTESGADTNNVKRVTIAWLRSLFTTSSLFSGQESIMIYHLDIKLHSFNFQIITTRRMASSSSNLAFL